LHLRPLLFHQPAIPQCLRAPVVHLRVAHMTLLQTSASCRHGSSKQ
jgi:hypothetical protein